MSSEKIMRTNPIMFLQIIVLCTAPGLAITPFELLDKYEETQKHFVTQITKSEKSIENHNTKTGRTRWHHVNDEFRYDGERYDIIRNLWYDMESKNASRPPEAARNSRQVWNGIASYDRWRFGGDDQYDIIGSMTVSYDGEGLDRNVNVGYSGSALNGYFSGDMKLAGEVLREASEISVREGTEVIGGSSCYIIDAVGDGGKYTIWIDPEHGYNIAKAKITRTTENKIYDEWIADRLAKKQEGGAKKIADRLAKKQESGAEEIVGISFDLDNVKFEKTGDIWAPVEAEVTTVYEFDEGYSSIEKKYHKRTYIDLDPDFEAIGAFYPEFRNGTYAVMEETPGIGYVWQDNKFVARVDNLAIDIIDGMVQSEKSTLNSDSALATDSTTGAPADKTTGIAGMQADKKIDSESALATDPTTGDPANKTTGIAGMQADKKIDRRTNTTKARAKTPLKSTSFITGALILLALLGAAVVGWVSLGRHERKKI